MIGIDTNVLVAASVIEHEKHDIVSAWLKKRQARFFTTLINVSELLRLLTHPRVFSSPLSIRQAFAVLDELTEYYDIGVTTNHPEWWKECLDLLPDGIAGNLIFDFQIAYTLASHGIHKIATFDRGFRRFEFMKVIAL